MRLEVTRKADLATKAVLALDAAGRRAKAAELADWVGTTPGFLSQVLTPLVSCGWVGSEPGPSGGYSIIADLDGLSVLDIIEAVEGPTDSGRCVLEDRSCSDSAPCVLHHAWQRARGQLIDELSRITLSTLTPEALSRAVGSTTNRR